MVLIGVSIGFTSLEARWKCNAQSNSCNLGNAILPNALASFHDSNKLETI